MGCTHSTANTYPGPAIRVRRESTHRSLTPLIPPPGRTPTPPPDGPDPDEYSLFSTDKEEEPDEEEQNQDDQNKEEIEDQNKEENEDVQKKAVKKNTRGFKNDSTGLIYYDPYDFRQNPEEMERDFSDPPTEKPYVDHEFGPDVALEGASVEWKRPSEFRENPVLFSEGTTRFDISQGCAGTCWFLSTIAMIADKPQYFEKIVPKDAWNKEGGYFYCHFWRFGKWETVYIDDRLPIGHGTQLWGAKSKDDQEMWPSMLEKAFARFHGKYNNVYGGDPGSAFLALTGGCSELLNLGKVLVADKQGSKDDKVKALHKRMKNAISSGNGVVMASVPKKHSGVCGLVGGHAYSVSDTITASSNGKPVDLVKVRNPWGNTEWTGAWSDKSPEWQTIPANSVPHADIDDGEFWICLDDFIKYFEFVTIGSLVPDVDKDGFSDSLNHCTRIYGQWAGKTAAGCRNLLKNPRYLFEVTGDGKIPIVLQICQRIKHRKETKTFAIRANLVKLSGKNARGRSSMTLQRGEFKTDYMYARANCTRLKVDPGKYLVVPACFEAGQEREFVISIFTQAPINDVRPY